MEPDVTTEPASSDAVVAWQPTHRRNRQVMPALASGGVLVGSALVGALAVGALAIGALAIGAIAIGRLTVGRVRLGRVEIDHLIVGRLTRLDAPD